MRTLNSKGNPVRYINFIYLHQTPYGYVNNGYTHEKYREIYLNARTKYESQYYESKMRDYLNSQSNHEDYVISYVDFRTIWLTPQKQFWKNFYVLENIKDKKFNIPKQIFTEILQTKYFYFLILDEEGLIDDEFIEHIKDIRIKYRIRREKFIYLGKNFKEGLNMHFFEFNFDYKNRKLLEDLDSFTDTVDDDFPTDYYIPEDRKRNTTII